MKTACLVLPLLGCVDTTPAPLDGLVNPRLRIGGGHEGLFAELSWDDTASADDCPVLLPSFRALANDELLTVYKNDYVTQDVWCLRSPLHVEGFSYADAKETVLVLADESMSISANLGDVSLRRTAVRTPDGPLAFGSEVTLAWWPVTDLTAFTARVQLQQGDSSWPLAHVIDGDLLRFTIPSDGRFRAGDAMLMVFMTDGEPPVCTNAPCTFAAARDVYQSVTLQ